MEFNKFKRRKNICLSLLLLLIIGLAACSDDSDCATTSADMVKINFYKKVRIDQEIAKEVDTISISRITTASLTDTVFYDSSRVSSVLLPVNPVSDTIHYILERSNRGKQNITLYYTNISRIIGAECGVERVITITDVKSPELDSITVVKRILQKNDPVHIEIYL